MRWFHEMSSRKRVLSSEPLDQSAFAGHVEHCLRQTASSHFRPMWELQEQPVGVLPYRVPSPSGPLPLLPDSSRVSSSERAGKAKAAAVSMHVASSIRISQTWKGLKDREMQAAIRKWIAIIRNTSRSDRSLLLWCKKVAVPQPSTSRLKP